MRDISTESRCISCSAAELQPGDIIMLTPQQYTRIKIVSGHREHVRLRQEHRSIAIVCAIRLTARRENVTVPGPNGSDITIFTPNTHWVLILSTPTKPFVLLEATEHDTFFLGSISHRAVIPVPVYALNVNDRFCNDDCVFHVTNVSSTMSIVNGGHDILVTVKAKQLPYVFDRQYNLITHPVAILPHPLTGSPNEIDIISESPVHRVQAVLSSIESKRHVRRPSSLNQPFKFAPIDIQTLLESGGLQFEDYCSAAARAHTMSPTLTRCVCNLAHPLLPVSTVDFFNNRPICINCMLALAAASVFHFSHVVSSSVSACISAQQQLTAIG